MKKPRPDVLPETLDEAFRTAYELVTQNGDLFEQFVEMGGLSLLRDGTYVLTLIDPSDPLGHAALRAFGLPGEDLNQELEARVFEVARGGPTPRIRNAATKALACMEVRLSMALAPVPQAVLPAPIRESLMTPGPFGTFPVLVIAEGCTMMIAWKPQSKAARS